MKTVKLIAAMFVLSVSLGACGNTLQGIGQDIERAGEKIQGAAK